MFAADDRDRLAPDASPPEKPTSNNDDLDDETLSWDLVSVSELSSRAASPGAALSIRSASSSMGDIVAIAAAMATTTAVRPPRPPLRPSPTAGFYPSHSSPSQPSPPPPPPPPPPPVSPAAAAVAAARAVHQRYVAARAARRATLGHFFLHCNPDNHEHDDRHADPLLDGLRVALERARTTASTRAQNLIRAFVGECAYAKTRAASAAKAAVCFLGGEGGGYLGVVALAAAAAAIAGWAFARGDASGGVRDHARIA